MLNLNSNKQITDIKNILSQRFLSATDCSKLIIIFRELVESLNLSKYPMIQLYGDMSVHPKLDRKASATILQRIEDQFSIPENKSNTSDRIAELFSIRSLQYELLSFHTQIPELAIFNNKAVWDGFISAFLTTIVDKPLRSKNPKSRISQMYLKSCCIDKEFRILPSHTPETFVWIIELKEKNLRILCKLVGDYPNTNSKLKE